MPNDIQDLEKRLSPEKFDASLSKKCDPGTYNDVLSHLTTLLMSTSENNIIWLHGPSSCGKSTVSFTLAEHFNGISRLGAYLHFHNGSSSPGSVVATITYKLASFDLGLGKIITDHVKRRHGELSVETQFEEFLLRPLIEGARMVNGPVIIILDGLDECGNVESLLRLFSSGHFAQLPRNFRFLITSRWEHRMAKSLFTCPNSIYQVVLGVKESNITSIYNLYHEIITKYQELSESNSKNSLLLSSFLPSFSPSARSISQPRLGYTYVCISIIFSSIIEDRFKFSTRNLLRCNSLL